MKLEALRLDTEAIRERVLRRAVVVKKDDEIFILVRACNDAVGDLRYFSLTSGSPWTREPRAGLNCDWVIRPGDEAEFSNDGKKWVKGIYRGIDGVWGNHSTAFCKDEPSEPSDYEFIRPVQTDPEKAKRLERIANMERELAELKKLEG